MLPRLLDQLILPMATEKNPLAKGIPLMIRSHLHHVSNYNLKAITMTILCLVSDWTDAIGAKTRRLHPAKNKTNLLKIFYQLCTGMYLFSTVCYYYNTVILSVVEEV